MKVLICGSRTWHDIEAIRQVLWALPRDTVIIHGTARGADSIAGRLAQTLGMRVEEFPAEWEEYGRAAGPIRNRLMLDEGRPDLVHAFQAGMTRSRGTADMISQARQAGVPVVLHSQEAQK